MCLLSKGPCIKRYDYRGCQKAGELLSRKKILEVRGEGKGLGEDIFPKDWEKVLTKIPWDAEYSQRLGNYRSSEASNGD